MNLVDGRLEAFSDPTGPAEKPDYCVREVFGRDDAVPLAIDGREIGRIPVRELLS